jgi:hypothetical protein
MIGLVHALLAGLVLAVMPRFHPAIPEALPEPGFLMIERGQAASVIFVLSHVGFGALMSVAAVSRRYVAGRRLRG